VITVGRGGKGVNGKREGAEKQGYRKLEAGDRKDKDTGNWRLETGDWENLKGVNGERSTVNGRGKPGFSQRKERFSLRGFTLCVPCGENASRFLPWPWVYLLPSNLSHLTLFSLLVFLTPAACLLLPRFSAASSEFDPP